MKELAQQERVIVGEQQTSLRVDHADLHGVFVPVNDEVQAADPAKVKMPPGRICEVQVGMPHVVFQACITGKRYGLRTDFDDGFPVFRTGLIDQALDADPLIRVIGKSPEKSFGVTGQVTFMQSPLIKRRHTTTG